MPGHPMLRSWGLNLSSPVFSSEDPQKRTPSTNTLQHASFVPETSALSKFFFQLTSRMVLRLRNLLKAFIRRQCICYVLLLISPLLLLLSLLLLLLLVVVVVVMVVSLLFVYFIFFGIDVKVMQDIRENLMEFCQK